jgi:hypothetical protein
MTTIQILSKLLKLMRLKEDIKNIEKIKSEILRWKTHPHFHVAERKLIFLENELNRIKNIDEIKINNKINKIIKDPYWNLIYNQIK